MPIYNFLITSFLKNKVVLVTGGNGQLGKDICKFYTYLGCKVYSLDIKHNKNQIRKKNYFQVVLDITKINECEKIIKFIIKKEKKIDILINNAGSSIFTHFSKRTEKELDETYSVNLKGMINMIISVTKNLRKNYHLKILNIGSIYGSKAPDFSIYKKNDRLNSEIYGATKAGIIQLTKYFAKILSKKKVICNCISPGGIKSNSKQNKSFQKRYIKNLHIKRMGNTSDIVFGLYYFSHPENSYITGQNLIIDGGYSL